MEEATDPPPATAEDARAARDPSNPPPPVDVAVVGAELRAVPVAKVFDVPVTPPTLDVDVVEDKVAPCAVLVNIDVVGGVVFASTPPTTGSNLPEAATGPTR